MDVNRDIKKFKEAGYVLHLLQHTQSILLAREALESYLQNILGQDASLEKYHEFVQDDDQHTNIHFKMLEFLVRNQFHLDFFRNNRAYFESLIGMDVDVQVEPHLRIARPNKPQDNIGFHDDISYGCSAYEVSCSFSLTNVVCDGAIKVLSKSHSQARMKTIGVNNEEVEKGSVKNKLGVPYLFQRFEDETYKSQMTPVPMEIGEVLCFNIAVVHGQEVNLAMDTRWSLDARLKSRFFTKTGVKEGYYKPLFLSPVTETGMQFETINPTILPNKPTKN